MDEKNKIILPEAKAKTKSKAQTKLHQCKQRAAIEPVVGHIKNTLVLAETT